MNSTGSLDNAPSVETSEQTPITPGERRVSVLVLLGVAGLLALALFAGFHIVSVFYGVINPPAPPLYEQMTQVSHESSDHGVDVWRYISSDDPDTIAAFYEGHGANCALRSPRSGYASDAQIGITCSATDTFSIFSMSYEVVITPEEPSNVIRVFREVFWIGSPPTTTP